MTHDDTQGDLSVLEAGERDAASESRRSLADVTIFGMRLCRRRKTDAEYVASVRKAVSHSKWMIAVYGMSAAVLFAVSLGMVHIVFTVTTEIIPEEAVDVVGPGLAVGLLFGFLAGYFLVQGGSSFIQMLTIKQGQRTERLMLKFYDELQRREANPGPTDLVEQS